MQCNPRQRVTPTTGSKELTTQHNVSNLVALIGKLFHNLFLKIYFSFSDQFSKMIHQQQTESLLLVRFLQYFR